MVLIVKLNDAARRQEFESWSHSHGIKAIPHKNFAPDEEIPDYARDVAKYYSIETKNTQEAINSVKSLNYIEAAYDDGNSTLAN